MMIQRNSEKNNNAFNGVSSGGFGSKIWAVVFLFIVVFILNSSFVSKCIKGFFYSISEPVQFWLWEKGIKSSDFFTAVLNSQILKQENDSLKSQNQKIMSDNILLEKLRKENETLKTALGLGLEKEFELDLASVVAKTSDYLTINKGYAHGLDIGMPVITESRVLVGRIVELFQDTSRIELLSAKDNSFDVELFQKDIYSLAKGQGGSKIILDLIPKEENIETGDRVITSSLAGNYPNELLVGIVDSIKKTDVTAFQEVFVRPSFDLSLASAVFVIKNK